MTEEIEVIDKRSPGANSLVKKLLVYKYVFIITLTTFVSFIIWHYLRPEITAKDVTITFLAAVVTAFLLSIFYDLFTKKEHTLQSELDRQRLLAHFANSLWAVVDLDAISPEQKELLAKRFLQNRETMEALARVISGHVGSQFLFTHLLNLWKGNILCDVEVSNTLSVDKAADGVYYLDFVQRFTLPRGEKEDIFVLFSCDNDFFNSLVTSPVVIDCMVCVSESDWSGITDLLRFLRLKSARTIDGVRETKDIAFTEISSDRLQKRLGKAPADSGKIRGFVFRLPPNFHLHQYVFSYKIMNSLNDPYYYWFAENPMLVKSITIDYSGLRRSVGLVSANCFIGNYSCDPMHDQEHGVYRIDVDGLVWPGQGALIVWRPPDMRISHGRETVQK
jgi:hypothetical protein